MKKINIIILLLSFHFFWGQGISVKYHFEYLRDSTDVNSKREDVMRLMIDENSSFYFSQLRYEGDSLFNIDEKRLSIAEMMLNREKYHAKKLRILVIKDKKNKKIRFSNKILNKIYTYTQDLKPIAWKLTNETDEYLGYPVQKAIGEFGGRTYVAWYTPEIPISDGPYKFSGLPGLILKIADTQNNFNFQCIEIKKQKDFSALKNHFTDRKSLHVSKAKYYEIEEDATKNFLNFASRNSGVMIKPVNGSPTQKKEKPYNPIER